MALTTDDFVRPAGRLTAAWYRDDLAGLLTAYLAEAATLTEDEDAQEAWVYYRAYATLVDDLTMRPMREAADDVSIARTQAQLDHWRRLRDQAKADYHRITETEDEGRTFALKF